MTACLALLWLTAAPPAPAGFVRPAKPGDPLVYGVAGGIAVALHPAALDGRRDGGPRGLLRVGQFEGDQFRLFNYVAVEPLVGDALGLSELEQSDDGRPGKRFTVVGEVGGRLEHTAAGDTLTVVLHVEPFRNGARPVVEFTLFEREPTRVRFRTDSQPGGAAMRRCTLSATMGNQSRCRHLWLRAGPVFAPDLFAGYAGTDFVEKEPVPLAALHRTPAGDAVVVISPDEAEPREVWPLPANHWHHDGRWLAQYWLKPKGMFDDRLSCRVNGRRVYWANTVPIPGGLSFENFELREAFRPGQEVWFGYTADSPAKAFGFGYDAAPAAVRRTVPAAEAALAPTDGLVNGDFAAGLVGWHTEGAAATFRAIRWGDRAALSTAGAREEADTGRLFQRFTVPADATTLRFRMWGGADPHRTFVALWHGDHLHRRTAGRDGDTPFRVKWDIAALRGRMVTLEVVDTSTARSGIGVEGFTLDRGQP